VKVFSRLSRQMADRYFTRNGSFVLNEQFNVVNSSGQALLAAAVDSSGKADLEKLSRLAIPVSTSGQATETSEIQLALNLPSDAEVIEAQFNRNNPATYNKSTALSVYDSGGNSYLGDDLLRERPPTRRLTRQRTNIRPTFSLETTR